MKRVLRIMICAAMIFALLLPMSSFGFESNARHDAEINACTHPIKEILSSSTTYTKNNSSTHKVVISSCCRCISCGTIVNVTETYYEAHDSRITGRCDGITTTETVVCTLCRYTSSITFPCRGSNCTYPHSTINSRTDMSDFLTHLHNHD